MDELDERAREKHVLAYMSDLRAKLGEDLPEFNERVLVVMADLYRCGWNDCAGWQEYRVLEMAQ